MWNINLFPVDLQTFTPLTREYWMIYRGPGFSSSYDWANPQSPVTKFSLSQTSCASPVELTDGRVGDGVRGGSQIIRRRGRESLVSINHSILSAFDHQSIFVAGTSRWGTTRPSSGGTGGTRSGTLFFSDWAPLLQFQRDTYHKS